MGLVKDWEITVPDNTTAILVAPSDSAFTDAIAALGLTQAEVLANTDLLKQVLSVHLAVSNDTASDTAMTLGGPELEFYSGGKPTPLSSFVKTKIFRALELVDTKQKVAVSKVVQCPDKSAIAMFVKKVLLPPGVGPAMGPGMGPGMAPGMAPGAAPVAKMPPPKGPTPTPSPAPAPPSSAVVSFASWNSVFVAAVAMVMMTMMI